MLEAAETETCGDGTAYVVHAGRWRWAGPRAGELHGSLTLRRDGDDGSVWELCCAVAVDPDEQGRVHVGLVVRWTDEARLAAGASPVGTWWCDASTLRPCEDAAIAEAAEMAVSEPPSRLDAPDADVVPLRLDAGSLGVIAGELRIVASLGLAYAVPLGSNDIPLDSAARALRAAVVDGRLAVPAWIRAWLERGGEVLALSGGAL